MSNQRGRLPSSPVNSPQPLPLPSFCNAVKSSLPSQPACRISAGCSDQNLKQGSHDPFLVEKKITHMEETFSPSENSLHQHAREEQAHDLQPSITREGIDEVQGKRHTMKELPIQVEYLFFFFIYRNVSFFLCKKLKLICSNLFNHGL